MRNLPNCGVTLDKETHRYELNGMELKGITSTILPWMFPDTYANVPQHLMDGAKTFGTAVHEAIEASDILGAESTNDANVNLSCKQCLEMLAEAGLHTEAHEYIVTDGTRIASPIDLVLKDADGKYVLADIKTTSEVYTKEVTLQLAIYKYLFEKQTGEYVDRVLVVWLPNQAKYPNKKPSLIEMKQLTWKETYSIIKAYIAGEDAEPYRALLEPKSVELPQKYLDVMKAMAEEEAFIKAYKQAHEEKRAIILDVMKAMAEEEAFIKAYKQAHEEKRAIILAAMKEFGVTRIDNEYMTITKRAESTRTTIDTNRLMIEYPDAYNECKKESVIKESISIKIKSAC